MISVIKKKVVTLFVGNGSSGVYGDKALFVVFYDLLMCLKSLLYGSDSSYEVQGFILSIFLIFIKGGREVLGVSKLFACYCWSKAISLLPA